MHTKLSNLALPSLLLMLLLASNVRVEIRIDGLSCPFCAYGLEKKLNQLEGIEGLKIDVEKGLIIFTLPEKTKVGKQAIEKIIIDAGFTPRDVQIIKGNR